MSARTQRYWTKPELALARQMEADGLTHAEIGRRLDRSAHGIKCRLCRPMTACERRPIVCSADQLAERMARRDVEDARDLRALRTGILTPFLLGDPPPGRSALDEKGRGA